MKAIAAFLITFFSLILLSAFVLHASGFDYGTPKYGAGMFLGVSISLLLAFGASLEFCK